MRHHWMDGGGWVVHCDGKFRVVNVLLLYWLRGELSERRLEQ